MSSKNTTSFALALIAPVVEKITQATQHDPHQEEKNEHVVEVRLEVFDPAMLHGQEPSPSRTE